MASTQTAGRKTLSLPPTAKNIRAAVKAGTRAPKVVIAKPKKPVKEAKVHTLQKVSKTIENAWVSALTRAKGAHKDALAIEVSVGLALYAQKGASEKVGLDAKRALMGAYADAGFACRVHTDEDYKNINRRINAMADLYVKLDGRQTITDWIDGAAPKDQVEAILGHVVKFGFEGINSILHYVGKVGTRKRPRNGVATKTAGATPQTDADKDMAKMTGAAVDQRRQDEAVGHRRAIDKLPLGRVFKAGAMACAVPLEATYDDVMSVIQQMTEFANNILRVDVPASTETKAPVTA